MEQGLNPSAKKVCLHMIFSAQLYETVIASKPADKRKGSDVRNFLMLLTQLVIGLVLDLTNK